MSSPRSSSSSSSASTLSRSDEGCPDPFKYPLPIWTRYEKIKTAIGLVVLLPLRLVLIIPLVIVGVLHIQLFMIGWETKDKTGKVRPLSKWRAACIYTPVTCYMRALMFLMGFHRIHIKGKYSGAKVLVSNHTTIVDGHIILTQLVPMILTKAENLKIPVVGTVIKAFQAIPVDRMSKGSKGAVLKEMKRRAQDGNFPPILVFPEGTTTNSRAMISFKRGAFACGVPVQPIILRFPAKHMNFSQVSSGIKMSVMLVRMLCQVYNSCSITFLDEVVPTKREINNPLKFGERVRKIMANELEVPRTSHCLEDALLLSWGHRENVAVNISVNKMRKRFNANVAELKGMLKTFHEIDINHDGQVDFMEFCIAMKLDSESEYAKSVFDALDKDDNGSLDFKELVVGMYLSRPDTVCDIEEKLNFAFSVYDVNGNSLISKSEALEIISQMTFEPAMTPEEEEQHADAIFGKKGEKQISIKKFIQLASQREDLLDVLPATLSSRSS